MATSLPKSLILSVGETRTITANISPTDATNKRVVWDTSDDKIVMLSGGKMHDGSDEVYLYAGIPGEATVNARILEFGGNIDARLYLKDSIVVTVEPNYGTVSEPFEYNENSGFAGWYYPYSGNKGIKSSIPKFEQTYAGPCLGFCLMMGDYYLNHKNIDVNEFFENRFTTSYGNSGPYLLGVYAQHQHFTTFRDFNRDDMKSQLEAGKPVIVSGNSGKWDHYVLVVGYVRGGNEDKDFIVIDPYKSYPFPTNYEDFKNAFPYDTKQSFVNNTYPMFFFI